ncbi:hypothetical protein CYJ29_06325 [Aerococcus loyolae]|uniref:Alpha/beta hydrolase n=2 Tax=Aerococcus TaxID=1375 RepID=A0A2I1L657_9LACT|nr:MULTISPECIES: alpha/beta hydrolase [Aerococcus]MCY3067749.1 alpha/beta hydrolase [Aerococcus mictus]MCY3080351.1 alpha/beta hydrolase [Aerococcus mictus]MDK6728024.1 alpha/beta hydrolase [Aerococcus urinae]MDK7909378.1 alpha/beta hydrolase [Aerococcus urinae]MDK8609679.1 alpha/beta hydrolase [Aerococcus urinae]
MKKKLGILTGAFAALYGYSHFIENRSLSSFLIENVFKVDKLLNKNSSSEDIIYETLEKSVEESKHPLDLPKKYVRSDVSEFFFQEMQVFSWNDKQDVNQKIIFYIHGGSYVAAPLSFHYRMVDSIARQTGAKVIFPIYEKVPLANYKDVFPKMLALYKKVLEESLSADRITIMGDSAGGGLALGLCLLLKEKEMVQPKNIILLSPWLDITNRHPKIAKIKKYDPMLDPAQLDRFGQMWSDGDINNQLVSPIHGDPRGLGKLSIFVGIHEIFYPDIMKYHKMLKDLNIDHNMIIEPRMNHVYVMYPIPEAKKAQRKIAQIIHDD